MTINTFKLEEYLAEYEFTTQYLLCCSDAESFSMKEIIDMASKDEEKLWDNLRLNYTEAKGLPQLRDAITKSLYPNLNLDNILCFAGAEEGIFCALHTICESQDHIIVLTPCYQSLLEIPLLKGAMITKVELKKDNSWKIDLEKVISSIRPNTKCIVINFPHNPTGQIITQSELNGLVEVCRQHNLWLFSDEVYRLLGNPIEGWAKPAAEIYEKALSLGVMSKSFGLAGLRIGWIASSDKELLKKIEQMKYYTSICNSAPSEILSLIAIKNKDKILKRNNEIVRKNLVLLDSFMQKYNNLFEWVKPEGGCVGFVKYKANEMCDDFAKRVLNKAGVLLMPASVYNYNENYFRIGFGRANMLQALEKFENFVNSDCTNIEPQHN